MGQLGAGHTRQISSIVATRQKKKHIQFTAKFDSILCPAARNYALYFKPVSPDMEGRIKHTHAND